MLRSLNGTFDLMQLLPVGIRISQHVEELSNENCRIAEPEPWHVAKLLGLFLSVIMHFILANSILIETFFLSFFFFFFTAKLFLILVTFFILRPGKEEKTNRQEW